MPFYYKCGNSFIKTKTQLKEVPESFEQITEEKYFSYHQITEETIDENALRIAQLKQELAATDYQCLKWSEGWLTDEEYAPIKAQRQELRDEINALENSTVIEGGN